jgi:hypothetical protein
VPPEKLIPDDTQCGLIVVETAEGNFLVALQQAEFLPNRLEQTEIRRFHAMLPIDRAAPRDRERAQTLLREALESYAQIGMLRHAERTQTLIERAASSSE